MSRHLWTMLRDRSKSQPQTLASLDGEDLLRLALVGELELARPRLREILRARQSDPTFNPAILVVLDWFVTGEPDDFSEARAAVVAEQVTEEDWAISSGSDWADWFIFRRPNEGAKTWLTRAHRNWSASVHRLLEEDDDSDERADEEYAVLPLDELERVDKQLLGTLDGDTLMSAWGEAENLALFSSIVANWSNPIDLRGEFARYQSRRSDYYDIVGPASALCLEMKICPPASLEAALARWASQRLG